MVSPPILVSKGNVMIGYNPVYEYAALPDVQRILAAIRKSISMKQQRPVAEPLAAEADERGRHARPHSGQEAAAAAGGARLQIHRALRCRSWAKDSLSQGCGFTEETGRSY